MDELYLEGVTCQICGNYIGLAIGYPQTCKQCKKELNEKKEKKEYKHG